MTGVRDILIVEDNEADFHILQNLLSNIYTEHDYELTWSTTHDDALKVLKEKAFDTVLCDHCLGEKTGVELIEKVHKNQSCPPPFILLTGSHCRNIDIDAMNAGASDYLVKQDLSEPLLERAIRYAQLHKEHEKSILRLAHFDQLTGLSNRTLFKIRLQENMLQAKRSGKNIALMMLDLDHFKEVNDTLGHPAGDKLLIKVSQRIKALIRESDTFARLGGDEFAIVTTQLNTVNDITPLIEKIIDAVKKPFRLGEAEVSIGCSVGLALFPDDAKNIDDLIKRADIALYEAKRLGRSRYYFFDKKLNFESNRRIIIQLGFNPSLDKNYFKLYFQPIVDLHSGEMASSEILLRWRLRDMGLISPAEFIPIAEQSGFIHNLGDWVLDQAFSQIHQWYLAYPEAKINYAINISGKQFNNGRVISKIEELLKFYLLPADMIQVEITENILLSEQNNIINQLNYLSDLGVKLSLDDFGTGYSSFSYLCDLPINKIKIDRSLLSDVLSNKKNSAIIEAILGIAQSLNLETVAEGIETVEQMNFLSQRGCTYGQGYLFSQAVSADQFMQEHLSKHRQYVLDAVSFDKAFIPDYLRSPYDRDTTSH